MVGGCEEEFLSAPAAADRSPISNPTTTVERGYALYVPAPTANRNSTAEKMSIQQAKNTTAMVPRYRPPSP
ncbi:hypothetical protein [Haloprofundus salilacus]|uniref:hypothetical protein n=1 Tax=Haloprofundus salilacus TaxID=2876190 RepID=UPI001CCF5E9A|nr:hypothetical protein [Haloprofundus salilacus]